MDDSKPSSGSLSALRLHLLDVESRAQEPLPQDGIHYGVLAAWFRPFVTALILQQLGVPVAPDQEPRYEDGVADGIALEKTKMQVLLLKSRYVREAPSLAREYMSRCDLFRQGVSDAGKAWMVAQAADPDLFGEDISTSMAAPSVVEWIASPDIPNIRHRVDGSLVSDPLVDIAQQLQEARAAILARSLVSGEAIARTLPAALGQCIFDEIQRRTLKQQKEDTASVHRPRKPCY